MAEVALSRRGNASKLLLAAVVAVPVAALTAWDEVLLAGPIVFLVEVLGFVLGLVAFTLLWAFVGLLFLGMADFVWLRIGPTAQRAFGRFSETIRPYLERAEYPGRAVTIALTGLGVSACALGVAAYIVLLGGRTVEVLSDSRDEVVIGFVVAVAIVGLVGVLNLARREVEAWVRRVGEMAKPLLRPLAALVSMVVFGPVLGWPLFRLLGYTRRSTYAMTLIAAPVFAGIWVPFYGLGVWGFGLSRMF